MNKTFLKKIVAVALSLTVLIGMLTVGLSAIAGTTYGVTVGFDASMVNANGTAYLPVTTEDGKAIMDTYGDWTTAFGSVYVDGVEWTNTGYSITGNYFYMGGLGMNDISKIEFKAGTELAPDSTCKSTTPIVIQNDLTLVKTDGVWAVQEAKTGYGVTVGFDASMVNANGTAYLPVTTEDGKAIMDTYGDWTTAFGSVYVDGVEWTNTGYSITGNYFYMGGLGMNDISKIEFKAGTELAPDSTCKSTTPIVIQNDLTLVKTDGVWAVQVIEEEKPTVTLGMMSAGTDGTWELTVDDISGFAASYYCVEATVDGVQGRIALEKSGDHFVIWPSFFTISGISAIPVDSFVIAEGALLQPVDPNTTGWHTVIDGTQFALATAFSAVNQDGTWAEQVIEEEKPTVTLGFDSAPSAGTFYFTYTADESVTQKYYLMEVLANGTATTAMLELGANWDMEHAFIWALPAATETLTIAEGTTLTECDSNAQVVSGGLTLTVTEELSLVCTNGTWAEQVPQAPTSSITLNMSEVLSDNSWVLSADDMSNVGATYYRAEATVDGVAGYVVLEKSGDGFVIWPSFFTMYGTIAGVPAESFTMAEGALLQPIDPNTTGWHTVIDGMQLKLASKFAYEKQADGTWAEQVIEEEKPTVTLGFDSAPSAGTFYFTYTADESVTQKYYLMEVLANGTATTAMLELGADWDMEHAFIWSLPAATETLTIAEGTTLTECDSNAQVVSGGLTLTVTEELSLVCTNGTWAEQVPQAPTSSITLNMSEVLSDNSWVLSADDMSNVGATYYRAEATVDGVAGYVVLEKSGDGFVIWSSFFTMYGTIAGVPAESFTMVEGALLQPIDPNTTGWHTVIDGMQLKLASMFAYEKQADGTWADPNATPPVEVTPLDAELTFGYINSANDWAFTVELATLPTANQWYMATIKVDDTNRVLLMEYDAAADLFYIYHHCFWSFPNDDPALLPQSSLVMPVGTLLVPISTPDASAVIADGQTLKVVKEISVSKDDGEWVDDTLPKPTYTDLTVDKMAITTSADQAKHLRSYILLSVVDALPPAGDEWWNNYDVYDVTVMVDGISYVGMLGGGGNASTLALYIPWVAEDDNILATATEIIVKAGSKGCVGLQGVSFPSDLRIYKENSDWKTAYDPTQDDPTQDVDLSNAVSVVVGFDHIDGANHLYLSALMPDGSKIMDTYGDWTTVFGSIRMGILNADGTYTWIEESNTSWSVTGSYFYMASVQLHLYDAIEVKKGTVLLPDASCQSQVPIVIANDFRMVRDEWEEWVVDGEFTNEPEYSITPNVPGSSDTGDTTKSPIAWIIVGVCAVALVLCVILGGKKRRQQ